MGANDQRLCFQGLKIPDIIFSPDFLSISHSVASDFVPPWTVAHQAPLFMGFPRQEYWSGLPFPSPGDLPDPGVEPRCPALQMDSIPSEPPGKPQPFRILLKTVNVLAKLICKSFYPVGESYGVVGGEVERKWGRRRKKMVAGRPEE